MARVLALLAAIGVHSFAVAQASGPAQVDRIDVRLYYHHSGKLSEPIDDHSSLWNTIIGAGDAKEPSTSVLVDVIVKSTPDSFRPKTVVRLTVTSERSGKVISQQTKNVGVYSAEGKYHVGFWLPNTGCDPLRLVARVQGGKDGAVHIPFKCGE